MKIVNQKIILTNLHLNKNSKNNSKIIEDCKIDVNKCLLENKTFLLILSIFLSKNSRINKDEIEKMALEYFKKVKIKPNKFVDKDSYYDFKSKLDLML